MALGVGIGPHGSRQSADPGRQVGEESAELTAPGAERAAQLVGLGDAGEAVEGFDKRPVWGLDDSVAGPVEDQRALRRGLDGELAREPALARPGCATHQHHPAPLAVRTWDQRPQGFELIQATDEGKRRGQSE